MKRSYKEEKTIEKAIRFLIQAFEKSGRNPKPVILHSIRVAMYLENFGYDQNIIIGALLHDLLEDTETTAGEIEKRFGPNVRQTVEANTFNRNIDDRQEQYKELFARCKKTGKDALIIKAADILDNSNYYGSDKELWEKAKFLVNFTREDLETEPIWEDLKEKCKHM